MLAMSIEWALSVTHPAPAGRVMVGGRVALVECRWCRAVSARDRAQLKSESLNFILYNILIYIISPGGRNGRHPLASAVSLRKAVQESSLE